MQGINILKRLAKLLKRISKFLALPILVLLLTILFISPSRLVEFTTNVADMNGLFRWALVFALYILVGGVMYLEGHLPIIDRIIRFRTKRKVKQAEKLAAEQNKQSPSGIETVAKEGSSPSVSTSTDEKKPEGLLSGAIKTGVGRVMEEMKNRSVSAEEKSDVAASINEASTVNKLEDEPPKVDTSSDDSDMSEDEFYSFLGSIQTSDSDDEETGDKT